jgi:hypothetical protein
MAHYAQINSDNIVVQVLIADESPTTIEWLVETFGETWIQTSYNTRGGIHIEGKTPLRYNFAVIGGHYDSDVDAFYAPQPFSSWILNKETYEWESPVSKPEGQPTVWNEEITSWDLVPVAPAPGWVWDDSDKVWFRSNPLVPLGDDNG